MEVNEFNRLHALDSVFPESKFGGVAKERL